MSTFTAPPLTLPVPAPEAQEASAALVELIGAEIKVGDGWISFARYMELALYAPGLGYYSGGPAKFGAAGDFITAPDISPLFARALARQVAEIVAHSSARILEIGAGSGRLAADLLLELRKMGISIERYAILEVSAALRERQHATIARIAPELVDRIEWLDALPNRIEGAIVANEVLDALPVHLLVKDSHGSWHERGVTIEAETAALSYRDQAAEERLVAGMLDAIAEAADLPAGYVVEFHRAAQALIATLAERITCGAAIFLDYGFPAHEYFHPQRSQGTLMAHYRHHSHTDPFFWPGLQDLTTHVDFTAIARSAFDAHADIIGYTSQAHFLMNCGIAEQVEGDPSNSAEWALQAQGLHRLTSEAEMGELFKVIAFGREMPKSLIGFLRGDRLAFL